MALIRSLTSGTSSLKAHQQRFDVISNNIANVNTVGFKSSRATFADQFNQTFGQGSSPNAITGGGIGGVDPLQIGLGVRLGSVKQDFSQGSIQTTNRATDLALQGDGFFVVQRNGQQFYSRAGAFSFDRDGYLVDGATGAYVQGYNLQTDTQGRTLKDANNTNVLNRTIVNMQVPPSVKSAPKQTTSVTIAGNLNSSAVTGNVVNASVNVYDSQGNKQVLRLQFTKQSAANTYQLQMFLNEGTTPIPFGNPAGSTTQNVSFNQDGTLSTPVLTQSPAGQPQIPATSIGDRGFVLAATSLNTVLGTASFDTSKPLYLTLAANNNLTAGLTQYNAQDTVAARGQDGYTTGDLQDLSVDQTGKVIGAFTNGQSEVLGQVIMAKFTNPGGLLKQGNNFFSTTPNSGLPSFGTAVETFPSTSISSKSIEESNVDLTDQFTDLISTQRAFEAASRTITISDQFLNEINSLKR